MLENAGEHPAIFGEDRKIPILMQGRRGDRHLIADELPASHRTAKNPVHASVTMIRPVRTVLAKRAPELRQDEDDRLIPGGSHLIGESRQPLTETCEQIRELSL